MRFLSKCLITGGAGFLGSHLSEVLVAKGLEVYCLDNFLTGNKNNIKHLFRKKNFILIEHDVIHPLPFCWRKKLLGVRYIYHLASPASPPSYQKFSLETLLTNSLGTYQMLKLAQENNSFFLLASTSEVYGDPKEHPQKETYFGYVNPTGVRACYDESKRFAESLTMEFYRKYQLKVRIVRIFNTYGPRMEVKDGRVISNFINQGLANKPLTIYGDGKQTRSFCYVDDMIRGLILAMEKEGIDGEIINLGNPEEKTIQEIAQLIIKALGKRSGTFSFQKKLPDDPQKRRPDITKAKKLLNWQPRVSLDEGIKRTIAYFRSL